MAYSNEIVRMDSSEDDYRQKLASAQAQAGMFKIMNEGAGGALTKNSRDGKYFAPTYMPGEVEGGAEAGFAQDPEGDPYNAPMTRPSQTGNLQTGMSSTAQPQIDPQNFSERIGNIARGQQGFMGYNKRGIM